MTLALLQHSAVMKLQRGVDACVSRLARPKVKSNKKETHSIDRQEWSDTGGRIDAAKAAIEGESSIVRRTAALGPSREGHRSGLLTLSRLV
jgi:hypothetical protein